MIKVLFCITSQFGYHTDTFMYCKHLDQSKFDIHYIGFDCNYPKRQVDGVQVHYIPIKKNKLIRYFEYVNNITKVINANNFDILFIVDSQASLLIRFCNLNRKSIMDVRTGDVYIKYKYMSIFNIKILLSSLFFKHITIISESLRTFLFLPSPKCHHLPLGAEDAYYKQKKFDTMKLFYIGTLTNRNIHQTIEGLYLFMLNNPTIKIVYNIVGSGSEESEKCLEETIIKFNLQKVVRFHGYKNHDEIKYLFEESNIGVVYIPIIKGYNFQPTTKLFEYLLSGMPVIATSTYENRKLLNLLDGVLVQDNPNSFALGLEHLWLNRSSFQSEEIRHKYSRFLWKNIVKNELEPYLLQILK